MSLGSYWTIGFDVITMRGTVWLPSREGGMDSKFQAMGRAIGVVLEVGKDIETHGDKTWRAGCDSDTDPQEGH